MKPRRWPLDSTATPMACGSITHDFGEVDELDDKSCAALSGRISHAAETRPCLLARGPPVLPRVISLARVVLRPWAGWAARSAIIGRNRSRTDPTTGRFTRADVRRLVRATWANFDEHAAGLPAEPTLGSRQNVLLAALTVAMFEALLDDAVDREYATELVGDMCWKVYAQWGRIPQVLSRLRSADPVQRMRFDVEMFLRFPFNRPGYRYRDQPEPLGRALDMTRCPVAEYLTSRDAADLTVGSWCNLDFQLARMWGGTLERHGTLAGGAPCCDFRFRADRA